MKIFLLCSVFALCSFAMTENVKLTPSNKYVAASALRLSPEYGKAYRLITTAAFKVDEKNILRPSKGYQVRIDLNTGKFRVGPINFDKIDSWKNDSNFDQEPIPGGTLTCFCNQGADDCRVIFVSNGSENIYRCGGNCSCIVMAECDEAKAVLGYESPGGGWFNF